MRNQFLLIYALAPLTVFAQATCPQVNFLTARVLELKPTVMTHIDVVRQSDGSYTGFEIADASPHRVVATTPHFEQKFAACLPHPIIPVAGATAPQANPPGAGSQRHVAADVGSGNYVVIGLSADQSSVHFDVFDAQHNLRSERDFSYSAPLAGNPTPQYDRFISLKLVDLNGDGKLDLAAEFNTNRLLGSFLGGVWTFIGNGDGTFQGGKRSVLTSTGSMQTPIDPSFAFGDFNGDGKPDIVFALPANFARELPIRVASGVGDGTFVGISDTSPTINSVFVAAADLNGDGKADVVYTQVASGRSPVVTVLLGLGNGSFAPGVDYPVPQAAGVAIGDLNGDGIPDIATGSGTIFFGDGKGAFPSRRDYVVAVPGPVLIGDLDGDGSADLIFGNGNAYFLTGDSGSPGASVLAATGKGRFAGAPISVITPGAFAAADFDSDGNIDVTVATSPRAGTAQLTFLRGSPTGDFAGGQSQVFLHAPGYSVRASIAGDFNHDGKPDLAVAGNTAASNLDIYPGNGDGTFGSPQTIDVPIGDDSIRSLVAVDLNSDGATDLVVTTGLHGLCVAGKSRRRDDGGACIHLQRKYAFGCRGRFQR